MSIHLPKQCKSLQEDSHRRGGRRTASRGGDQFGANLRQASYTVNNLNEINQRTVPGYVDVIGSANSNANVMVKGNWGAIINWYGMAFRKGEYFRAESTVDNSSSGAWLSLTSIAALPGGPNPDIQSNVVGNVYVPKTPEAFVYDLDGNLTSDGRWNYTWDAENRLVKMAVNTPIGPQLSLQFEYDSKGRRIRKQVWPNTTWTGTPSTDLRFVYDGWNLLASLNPQLSALNNFMWGLDLSGSVQGAGGVGGLLSEWDSSSINNQPSAYFAAFDGNGNVAALVNAGDGTISAQYEYGPFGEVIRSTGPMAKANPFRFSTKYQDGESDLLYYGYRYYNASTGRWIGRDPAQEEGGANMNVFNLNNGITKIDALGLWATSVHHQIVEDWLTDPKYRNYPWRCCIIDVVRTIQGGSDDVDGVFHNGVPSLPAWCEAQSSVNSYQHAMRDGAADQSVGEAQGLYNKFLTRNLIQAVGWASYARENGRCYLLEWSLNSLGRAYHSFSDSLSPAHSGFQPW